MVPTDGVDSDDAPLDPSLPSEIQLARVDERPAADGSTRVTYTAAFEELPILGLARRGRVGAAGDSGRSEVQWARPWIFAPAALDPIRVDAGEPTAVAAVVEALAEAGVESLPIVEVERGWIPTVVPRAEERFIEQLELGYRIVAGDDGGVGGGGSGVDVLGVMGGAIPRRLTYLVAGDGRIVDRSDSRHYVNAIGHSFYNRTVSIEVDWDRSFDGDEGYHLVDRARANLSTNNWEDGTCPYNCTTKYFFSRDLEYGSGDHASVDERYSRAGETAGVEVHYGTGVYWDFLKMMFGRRGPLDADVAVHSIVNIDPATTDSATSAFFDAVKLADGYFGMTFYTAPISGERPFTTLQAVAHEQTHAMVVREIAASDGSLHSGVSTPHVDMINEGLADIFGMMTDLWHGARGATIPNTSGIWTFGALPGHAPRYFHRPSADERIVGGMVVRSDDAYPPTSDDDHLAAGILRRAFYFLAQGVVPQAAGPVLATEYGSTFLPNGLVGLSNDVAARLFYAALVEHSDVQPDYLHFRNAVAAAAAQQFGTCSPEHKAAIDAFAAVNLGSPADRTPPTGRFSVEQTRDGIVVTMLTEARVTGSLTIAGVPGRFPIEISEFSPPFVPTGVLTLPLLTFPATGTYEMQLTLEDTCKNTTVLVERVTVDRTPPAVTITTSPGVLPHTMVVRAEASDPHAIVQASILFGSARSPTPIALIGSQATYVGTFSFADELHGPGRIAITTTDTFGNTGTTIATPLFDLKPPTCTFEMVEDGLSPLFGVTARDDSFPAYSIYAAMSVTGVTASGHEITRLGETIRLNFPSAGAYPVVATCLDAYGNLGVRTWTLDVSARPVLNVGYRSLTTSGVVAHLAATDDTGIVEWFTTLSCGAATPITRRGVVDATNIAVDESFSLAEHAAGTLCSLRFAVRDRQNQRVSDLREFLVPSPPPLDVWVTESEPNDTPIAADVLPSNVTGVRGTNAGFVQPTFEPQPPTDMYAIDLPPGARLAYEKKAGTTWCSHVSVARRAPDGLLEDASDETNWTTAPSSWQLPGSSRSVPYVANTSGATRRYYVVVYRVYGEQATICPLQSYSYEVYVDRL